MHSYKKIFAAALTVVSLLTVTAGPALSDSLAFNIGSNGAFGTLDLATGTLTQTGNAGITPAGLGEIGSTLFTAADEGTGLYTVNILTGSVSQISNLGLNGASFNTLGSTATGLYALDNSLNLYSINPATGVATLLGPTGAATGVVPGSYGFSLSTGSSTLYFENDFYLYSLNTTTGLGTLIGQSGAPGIGFNSLVSENGTLYGVESSNSLPYNTVYTINTSTGLGTLGATLNPDVALASWGMAPAFAVPEPGPLMLFFVGFGLLAARAFTRKWRLCSRLLRFALLPMMIWMQPAAAQESSPCACEVLRGPGGFLRMNNDVRMANVSYNSSDFSQPLVYERGLATKARALPKNPTSRRDGGHIVAYSSTAPLTLCPWATLTLRPGKPYLWVMQANLKAPQSYKGLSDYAAACGYTNFNWQSEITYLPPGTGSVPNDPALLIDSINVVQASYFPFFPFGQTWNPVSPQSGACRDSANWAGCSLIAGPTFPDPPYGGYVVLNDYNPYPFYYPQSFFDSANSATVACTIPGECPKYPYVVSYDGTTLSFVDIPAHPTFSGAAPSTNPPVGQYAAYKTTLVGVSNYKKTGSALCDSTGKSASSGLYCTALYAWTWNSTYNGTACNGILSLLGVCSQSGVTQTASLYPAIPGSGTGGVTVTGLNGIQLPPSVPEDQIATTASGLAYSRVSQTFDGTVTLNNISDSSISGPLQIFFFGVAPNITLSNETGSIFGTPYITVSEVASLAPGQSATVQVKFQNASSSTINFTPAVYAGSMN